MGPAAGVPTGYEEFYGKALPTETLEELARQFPRLPLVFAHALFPKFDDAWRLIERYDNVWLEMTNVFSSFFDRRYAFKEYPTERRLLFDGIGARSERIMFGTDHPVGSGTIEEIHRVFEAAGLAADVRERLVGGTAARFISRFWPDFGVARAPKPRPR